MRVFGEPLIQHLLLDESEYANANGTMPHGVLCRHPFAISSIRIVCGLGCRQGLQVVATDHCAFTTEQKRYGIGDFTKIPNGTGGLEDRMPLL